MDLSNLDKMKVVDLRNELQTRGLDTKGVKAVLIERLRAHIEGGSGGVPPSPGTPGRRSRRTRSMTKSPSPSPVKKSIELPLETLEEEIILPDDAVEEGTVEEKLSTPEKVNESSIQETIPLKENLEKENSFPTEEVNEIVEEYREKDDKKEETNGADAKDVINNEVDEPKNVSENPDTVENDEKDVQEKSPKEKINHLDNDEKSECHDDNNQDDSSKKSKSLRDRSRSYSADRRNRSERHNQSLSRSRSRSRSPHHKSKSRSHSRTRSRSPKRRSGAASLGSPTKDGEDTSTPEDEPTIEENQFGLSWFDSDLHLRIDPVTFTSAKPMSHDIYALVWSGARTNYGVREGKVCFEVRLSEETNLNREHPFRDEPYTKGFRVGFSKPSSNLLLGESENSFAYCESGRKATNGEFVEFAKPFHLDDVIGCYLDLESTPCTIKYTLNGEDLGVAFEFDKTILGENEALFPHVLTKGYEYDINLADNDNLLVNRERKVRKRRKVKPIDEKKEDNEKHEDDKKDADEKNSEKSKEETIEEAKTEEQLRVNAEIQEQQDEPKVEENSKNEEKSPEKIVEKCEKLTEENEPLEKNITEEENSKSLEIETNPPDSEVTNAVEHIEKENDAEKSSVKGSDDGGPSPSKRQKVEAIEEDDEYEEIHPEYRDHMFLLEEYELIALIPEEKYIPGPQRPNSRKDCEVILMVGLPGAGKTTWVLNHIKENSGKRYHVIGADALIGKMTIDGVPRKSVHKGRFDRIYELCFNVLTSLEDIAIKRRRNFILDQANAYASAQRRKMKGFADFKRIAVVCIPNEEELKRRLADKKEKGHAYTLKESTLNTLQAAFTLPSLEFGWFDEVIFTDLGVDEAKEEVKKYNEKGKKALDENHSNRDKRQRRDNYRSDNRRRQDDRRRYDNRNDNRWNDRRVGGGGGGAGYYQGGGNKWGNGGGYRNNSGGYRDDRGYGGGGGGRGYDYRHQRFNSGPQNWVQNNRNRYDDRNNRYSSGGGGGGGGSGRYDSYANSSRDNRSGGGDRRDNRDRNRDGTGGGTGSGSSNRRDGHRSGGNTNQRDFRHGHRDTREDSRGGSSTTPATETSSKYKSSSVASSNNGGYDKYNKNEPQANNWSQYQQQVGSAGQQQDQQQYWNYDMQGYGNQQQWQTMDPQQQQQWMSYWQQQGGAQQAGTTDPNQYWSQYSYSTSTDATKK